jgi:hypothetical protein
MQPTCIRSPPWRIPAAGIRLGTPLIAGGGGGVTDEERIRSTVAAIVEGLAH